MNRQQKIDRLLGREADDRRRRSLDEIDRVAREVHMFGSSAHRAARARAEKRYDNARRALEVLTDEQLDRELASPLLV